MTLLEHPGRLVGRLAHPRTTVRWRLTLLYGGLFLASGAALLAITYALVAHAAVTPPVNTSIEGPRVAPFVPSGPSVAPSPSAIERLLGSRAGQPALHIVTRGQRVADLHTLVIESGIALAIMAIASMLLGWWVAGRVLRPLRAITATTQRISDANLHERLAIRGPRDELRRLADTIDALLERLEAAFESQRRFVANASHELRTPLATMRATLDVEIAKPDVPARLKALDADLREDLDQADRLLESFLVLARAQRGELGTQASVSLAQIVSDALAARGDEIAAKHLELHTALAPVRVTGGETLLARMIENVIENAVRHNQTHGVHQRRAGTRWRDRAS